MLPYRERYRATVPETLLAPILDPLEQKPRDGASGGNRDDGRASNVMLRPMFISLGIATQANGSAYVEAGSTKVSCSVHGPRPSSTGFSDLCEMECSFKYATFASRNGRNGYQASEKEMEIAAALKQALSVVVRAELYPKSTIEVHVLVIEDDGGALPTAIVAATMALLCASIELFDLVSAVRVVERDGALLVDPTAVEEEEARGSIIVAHSASLNEVTYVSSSGELDNTMMTKAMGLAVDGCNTLHKLIRERARLWVSSKGGDT